MVWGLTDFFFTLGYAADTMPYTVGFDIPQPDPSDEGGQDGVDTGVVVEDTGDAVATATTLDFVGGGVTATDTGGGKVTVSVPGGGVGVDVEDESTLVATAATIDFVGGGVTAANAGGGTVTVTVPGAAPAAIRIEDEGGSIVAAATGVNFAGAGVVVTDAGANEALVTIPAAPGGIAGVRVEDEGSSTVAAATGINFAGAGVTVTDAGANEALVTIPASYSAFIYDPGTVAYVLGTGQPTGWDNIIFIGTENPLTTTITGGAYTDGDYWYDTTAPVLPPVGPLVNPLDADDYAFTYGAGQNSATRRANTDLFQTVAADYNAGTYDGILLPEQIIECELYGDETIPNDGSWAPGIQDPNHFPVNVLMQLSRPCTIIGAGGIPHPDLDMVKLPGTNTGTIIDIYPKDLETLNAASRYVGGFHDNVPQQSVTGAIHDWSGFTIIGPEKYTSNNAADSWLEQYKAVKFIGYKNTAEPYGVRSFRLADVHFWGGSPILSGPARLNIERCSVWDSYEICISFQSGTFAYWFPDNNYVLLDVDGFEYHNRTEDEAVRTGGVYGLPSFQGVHIYISPHLSYHLHSTSGDDNVFWPAGRYAIYENGEESGVPTIALAEDCVFRGSTLQIATSRSQAAPTVIRRATWENGYPIFNANLTKGSLTFEDSDLTYLANLLDVGALAGAGPSLLRLLNCTGSNANTTINTFIQKIGKLDNDNVLIEGGTYTFVGAKSAFVITHQNAGGGGQVRFKGCEIAEGAGFNPTSAMFDFRTPTLGLTTIIVEGTLENPINWAMSEPWFFCTGTFIPAHVHFIGGEYITFDGTSTAANWVDNYMKNYSGWLCTYEGATPPTFSNFTGTPTAPTSV